MKRVLCGLLACMMMVTFAACGGNKVPDGMAQETYDIGLRALEVLETYNDRKMSSDEADERLDGLRDELDALEFEDVSMEDILNGSIESTIMLAQTRISRDETTIDEVRSLKEELGIK